MEKPPTNLANHSMINNTFKSKEYPHKAKGMSFFAFVVSIFIYISIFYIFNLSPSKLFYNTKFWFFISNTLILIIAVDYGSFSSSSSKAEHKHDLYEEYVVTMRRHRSVPALLNSNNYSESMKTHNIDHHDQEEVSNYRPDFLHQQETRSKVSPPSQRKLSVVYENDEHEKPSPSRSSSFNGKRTESSALRRNNKLPLSRTLRRSQSESTVKKVVIDESKNVVRRIETTKPDDDQLPPHDHDQVEEKNDNKYANMSNEELNRRVEEFIERFNKQIRLQEMVYSRVV